MNALAARRRHPAAIVILLLLGLVVTGGIYAFVAPKPAQAAAASADDVAAGKKLFLANCSTCHGRQRPGRTKAGPSLAGVGAASVDFQVGTGRMPLANPGVQAMRKAKQVHRRADHRSSRRTSPRWPPARPSRTRQYTSGEGGDVAKGGELFRVNCAMCHNYAGSGGALTRGKYAPSLHHVTGTHIYEAMVTGPQSMPVFNDANISPENKRDIIAFLHNVDKNENVGGLNLGNFGPVSEGLLAWTSASASSSPCPCGWARRQRDHDVDVPMPDVPQQPCEPTGSLSR